jgi:hypothetical protein
LGSFSAVLTKIKSLQTRNLVGGNLAL